MGQGSTGRPAKPFRPYSRRTALLPLKWVLFDIGKDRKSTRLNSSHGYISYAVFCLKKEKILPGLFFMSVVRSPYPHAKIHRVDRKTAPAPLVVVGVYSGLQVTDPCLQRIPCPLARV